MEPLLEKIAELKKQLECPICLDTFDDPICVIECGHTFCDKCIRTAFDGGAHRCPFCRKPIGLVLHSLVKNVTVKQISSLVKKLDTLPEMETYKPPVRISSDSANIPDHDAAPPIASTSGTTSNNVVVQHVENFVNNQVVGSQQVRRRRPITRRPVGYSSPPPPRTISVTGSGRVAINRISRTNLGAMSEDNGRDPDYEPSIDHPRRRRKVVRPRPTQRQQQVAPVATPAPVVIDLLDDDSVTSEDFAGLVERDQDIEAELSRQEADEEVGTDSNRFLHLRERIRQMDETIRELRREYVFEHHEQPQESNNVENDFADELDNCF